MVISQQPGAEPELGVVVTKALYRGYSVKPHRAYKLPPAVSQMQRGRALFTVGQPVSGRMYAGPVERRYLSRATTHGSPINSCALFFFRDAASGRQR